MIYSGRLNNIQKQFLCQIINNTRPPDASILANPHILGCYRDDFIKQVIEHQKPNMNEKGLKVVEVILTRLGLK